MIVLICGGRDFDNRAAMKKVIDSLKRDDIVMHGGATGADVMAGSLAQARGIHVAEVPALWSEYGRAAGHRRNAAMLSMKPHLVIAFPGGRGTADCIAQAEELGITTERITWA